MSISGTPSFVLEVIFVRIIRYALSILESNFGTLLHFYAYICVALVVLGLQAILVMLQRNIIPSYDIIIISFEEIGGCGLNNKKRPAPYWKEKSFLRDNCDRLKKIW